MTVAHASIPPPRAGLDSARPAPLVLRASTYPDAAATATRRTGAGLWAVAMVLVVAVVGALAYWDGRREAAAALEDFGEDQAHLATAVSAELFAHLRNARRDAWVVADGAPARVGPMALANTYAAVRMSEIGAKAVPPPMTTALTLDLPAGGRTVSFDMAPQDLVALSSRGEQPGRHLLLLLPPTMPGKALRTDGRIADAPAVLGAFATGASMVRLSRSDAAKLGLPSRAAMAGVVAVDMQDLGRWGVAVVTTAASERDREQRAAMRLVLSVLLAGGTVAGFGAIALHRQRRELDLERELALSQLQHRRDERLVRANRAATMGALAMGIAHEISTPLGVIAGRADQLLARPIEERAERGVRAIAEQAQRISEVVRGFLDLARGGAPTISTVAPEDVAAGAVRLVEHKFASAKVSLSLDIPTDLPAIHCDLRLVEHALINLLLNACDACEPDGHVELRVRATGEMIAFVVNDDGEGISEEDAARAMEPFFSTKGPLDGTGLGLAIAHEIAKSHRGTLTLTPQARGARATLQLPVVQEGTTS